MAFFPRLVLLHCVSIDLSDEFPDARRVKVSAANRKFGCVNTLPCFSRIRGTFLLQYYRHCNLTLSLVIRFQTPQNYQVSSPISVHCC
ncbi:hypothetical protein VN97_g7402 [Penicillium thymicola]|uniref:Secreted protein n=1 Tax=Penicillium thymicola TaxID=293382 RepID=A0AAI9TFA4_PENTH|nr:hypothetical protein VN97_g7402 [Penicillium thymicola]